METDQASELMSALPIPDAALDPPPEECAYAAGFFDGEGTVFIAANHRVKAARGTIYNMRVLASQVDPTPLAWLQERWGGSLTQREYKTSQRRPCWTWVCCAREAAKFLRDIRPYLLTKDAEADIAVEFQDAIFNPGVKGHTAEYRHMQEQRRQWLMEMKQDKERLAI